MPLIAANHDLYNCNLPHRDSVVNCAGDADYRSPRNRVNLPPKPVTDQKETKPNQKIGVYNYESLRELVTNTWTRLYPDSQPRDPQDIIQHMEAEILELRNRDGECEP